MATFAFGKNWQSFLDRYLDPARIECARKSLTDFTGLPDFTGKTFIDVGTGSGIYSLAARQLGATEVMSFDVDPDCVVCCEKLRAQHGNPSNWRTARGSIIDDGYIATLPQYDVVYSWGVLHHTGKMWKAIENAMKLTKPGGILFIAIYNRADGLGFHPDGRFGPSWLWKIEKRFYVSLPPFLQNCVDYIAMAGIILLYCLTLQNPVRVIREHKDYFKKGMSWRINIKDWLGGYPYEYATVAEIFAFARQHGFTLENLTCSDGLLNNEFLLRRSAILPLASCAPASADEPRRDATLAAVSD